nr:zf-TFIIB domain-containing protein [Actinoplanes durhamensis]
MTCPKCHGEMRVYERSGVTVDQCTECRGIFLDRGELEKLFEAESSWNSRQAPPARPAAPAAPMAPPPGAYTPPPPPVHGGYGAPPPAYGQPVAHGYPAAAPAYGHHGHYRQHGHHGHYRNKRRKGFLGELFD